MITDILEENVVQPLLVSTSAIKLAAETVRSILKIDDIVSCTHHQPKRTHFISLPLVMKLLSLSLSSSPGECPIVHHNCITHIPLYAVVIVTSVLEYDHGEPDL